MAEDENDRTSALRGTDLERPFPTSDSPAVPLRSGTVLAGRYEIGKTIGQGGMGVVVQAFDRTLGVEVAIKIVRAEYAGEREWSERLAREVKLARQIQHAERLPRLRLRAGGREGLPDHGAGHRWHAS